MEAFQTKKCQNFGLGPPESNWDFFELWIFLKRNDPLIFFLNKLNMKNVGTQSVNMSNILVYLAMSMLPLWNNLMSPK